MAIRAEEKLTDDSLGLDRSISVATVSAVSKAVKFTDSVWEGRCNLLLKGNRARGIVLAAQNENRARHL